ncbi:MAG: MFS transporter [Actinomycetota bacterium]|nr:MFS transporter [Actinomycetota bacterium]
MFLEKGVGEKKRWFYPISSFLLSLGLSTAGIWTIFYPHIQEYYNLEMVANIVLASLFIGLGQMLFGPMIAGFIVDKYGPKIPYVFSMISIVSGYLIISRMLSFNNWNSAMPLWYIGSFFLGLGQGLYSGTYSTTVAKWFPDKPGTATGLGVAGLTAASIIYSPVIAFMIRVNGFNKKIFLLFGLIAVIMLSIAIIFWKNPTHNITLDLLKLKNDKLINKISQPEREFTLLEASKSAYFWILFTGFLCASFAQMFFVQNASMLIIEGLEASMGREQALAVVVPSFLIISGFAGLLGGFGWGFIIDRLGGPWRTLPLLYFSTAVLILLFYFNYNSIVLIMIFGFLLYLGLQGEPTVHYASISYVFGRKHLGKIMTTLQAFSVGLGISLGPFLGAYIKDVTGGYFWAIMLAVALRIIATIASLIGLRISKKRITIAKNLSEI